MKNIVNNRPRGVITRMHIFLATCYVFGGKVFGSYLSPKDEEEAIEDINHFKFLTKYSDYLGLMQEGNLLYL